MQGIFVPAHDFQLYPAGSVFCGKPAKCGKQSGGNSPAPVRLRHEQGMDDSKKAILEEIFWAMNTTSSSVETAEETVIVEEVDEDGNIVPVEKTETITTLYISVAHKTAETMADEYGFSEEQKQMLRELLQDENTTMWSAVLYGIHSPDEQIVAVAASQIGNVGGQPYWSWYGFSERVEWCACFVSWCANECGYICTMLHVYLTQMQSRLIPA